ncbi:hypothetical protein JCM10914_3900 [Paenibacillus sp. JCM 10914]|nr:hypothetical protein JCM10914_3900 [Paenibacillus sp. JCM 10914]
MLNAERFKEMQACIGIRVHAGSFTNRSREQMRIGAAVLKCADILLDNRQGEGITDPLSVSVKAMDQRLAQLFSRLPSKARGHGKQMSKGQLLQCGMGLGRNQLTEYVIDRCINRGDFTARYGDTEQHGGETFGCGSQIIQ